MAKKTNKSETRTSNIPVKGKKNEQKKEKGEFCFKYTKNLDKYTSLYVYATRDTEEPRDSDSIHKVETLLEWMIEDLKEYDETIHTLKIENAHPIEVKED